MSDGTNKWYYKLNWQLIKQLKPCMPGDMVHIKTFKGMYKVYYVYVDYFVVMKKRKLVNIPWEDFLFLKGEGVSMESSVKKEIKNALTVMQLQQTINADMINKLEGMLKQIKQK